MKIRKNLKKGSPALILADEWIGLDVEVVDSPNSCEIGIKGRIVDETMKTFRIRTEKGDKIIEKMGRTFLVRYKKWILKVRGDLVAFRPEERVKKGIMLIKRAKN